MKSIILRKPSIMRNDRGMVAYLRVAEVATKLALESEEVAQQYEFLKTSGEMIKKAAKAGGFFSVEGMRRWLDNNKK